MTQNVTLFITSSFWKLHDQNDASGGKKGPRSNVLRPVDACFYLFVVWPCILGGICQLMLTWRHYPAHRKWSEPQI